MNIPLLSRLHEEGHISGSSLEKIKIQEATRLLSLHWETRVLLYLGIMLLTGGLGILVYKNIDTIGHQAILFFIALICTASFYYCLKNKKAFSVARVVAPNAFFDYILLLGCLSFIIFIGYFQYQYAIFGSRFGLAIFVPMLLLFFSAYYFDHLGVLSLGITNLGAWLGVTATPLQLLETNDFNSSYIIFTAGLLGILLVVLGIASVQKNIKPHFWFTYTNFGIHLIYISILAAMFQFEPVYLLGLLLLLAVAYYFYREAKKERSFYILIVSTLYTYIGCSYVVINLLDHIGTGGMAIVYLGLFYFIISGIGLVLFLMRTGKILKA